MVWGLWPPLEILDLPMAWGIVTLQEDCDLLSAPGGQEFRFIAKQNLPSPLFAWGIVTPSRGLWPLVGTGCEGTWPPGGLGDCNPFKRIVTSCRPRGGQYFGPLSFVDLYATQSWVLHPLPLYPTQFVVIVCVSWVGSIKQESSHCFTLILWIVD